MAIVSPELMKKWGIKPLNEYNFLIKSNQNERKNELNEHNFSIKSKATPDSTSHQTVIKNEDFKPSSNEKQRLGRGLNPEWVKEQLKNEGCELINEYKGCESELIYRYKKDSSGQGAGHHKIYSITWHRWNKGERPHKCDDDEIKIVENPKENGVSIYCIRKVPTKSGKRMNRRIYNPEYIKMIFQNEDCEVLNAEEYLNVKTKLKYKYIGNDERCKDKDKIYSVCFNNWKSLGIRKHFKDYGKSTKFFNGKHQPEIIDEGDGLN